MAIAFVGAWTGVQFNANTGGTTGAQTVTAGNFIAIATTCDFNHSTTTSTTISPTQTILQANPLTNNGGVGAGGDFARLEYVENTSGASTTITVTLTAGGTGYTTICAAEYSGVATSSSLDQHSMTATGNSTTLLSASVTTTQANEIIFGHGTMSCNAAGAWVAGSGYTIRSSVPDETVGSVDFLEEQIVSATGSYTAGATKNGNTGLWICGVATFKAAATADDALTTPRPAQLNVHRM